MSLWMEKNIMDMSGIEDSLKSIDTDIYSNTRIVKENVKVNKVNAVKNF